jgi:sugar lactone lactonase YvrE
VRRGFALEEPDGSVHALPDLWGGDAVRMNEGGCDPDGRFYCGSMAYDHTTGGGALYRLDADREVGLVLEDVTISNGLDWSPDGARAYYVDTPTRQITVFDYDGELRDGRPFARTDAHPDGLTVDAEGGVWVALYDGGAVLRFTRDGSLDARIDVPAGHVTACTFGGERLDRLFITSSREGMQPGEDPAAGSLYAAEPGVRGLPVREFAG